MKGQKIVGEPGRGCDQARHIERDANCGRTAR
jgi:hypothetical protein